MAMISCSECGKSISDKASACPSCGAPIVPASAPAPRRDPAAERAAAQRLAEEDAALKSQRRKSIALGVFFVLAFGFIAIMVGSNAEGLKAARPPPPSVAAMSVAEPCLTVARKFGVESGLTDLQKEQLWKSYEGKVFTWKMTVGEVSSNALSGYTVSFLCPGTSSVLSDVDVEYPARDKKAALGLRKGATYEVKGRLKRSSALLGLSAEAL